MPLAKTQKSVYLHIRRASKNKKYLSPVRAHGNVPLCSKHFFQKIFFFYLIHSAKMPLTKRQKAFIYIYKERLKTKNIFPPYGHMAIFPHARSIFFKRKPSFIRCIPQKRPLQKGKKAKKSSITLSQHHNP